MANVEITINIDPDKLITYTDAFLATAWHVAQANPAPFGDYAACNLVEKLAREIVRRFLRNTEPELWHHQGRHENSQELGRYAKYVPPKGAEAGTVAWHYGEWVPREPDEVRERELLAAAKLIEDRAAKEDSQDVVNFARQTASAIRSRARAVAPSPGEPRERQGL